MKKLVCLYTGLLVFSFSAKAMDAEVIELDTASPVEYTLRVAQTLKEASIQKCIDVLVSDTEYSHELLGLLEAKNMKVYRNMIKAALINDYLVVLCKLFEKELTVKELDYYKKREPQEGLSERDCVNEGVVAGVLTSNDGIVFLSFRKEGHEYGTYLDYWFLGDLVNDEIEEKKPTCQNKIPARFNTMSPAKNFFPNARMYGEKGTNRFLIYFSHDKDCRQSECQLWRLEEEGFEHELTLELLPTSIHEFRFSPDGSKLCIFTGIYLIERGRHNRVGDRLLFEDIDTLKSHAVERILKKEQVYSLGISGDEICKNHPLDFLHKNKRWFLENGIMARLDGGLDGFIMIEYRDADDITQTKSCLRLSQRGLGLSKVSVFRILARGRYLLASGSKNLWLIDIGRRKAECISNYVIGPSKLHVMLYEELKKSDDERFVVIIREDKTILYDLKRKMNVEIRVGSTEVVSENKLESTRDGTYTTYLTSSNDILLSCRVRRICFVCLKSVLKAKSLRELVEQIKKRNAPAINRENTHHQNDGE